MPPKTKIRIPIHVFFYTLASIPGGAYAYYWYKNVPSDSEFEAELSKNYSHRIQQSRDKHEAMTTFLKGIKEQNSEQERKMAEVLRGGKGQKKRLFAVDESIYGTEEGAELQQKAQLGTAKGVMGKRGNLKRKHAEGQSDEMTAVDNQIEESELPKDGMKQYNVDRRSVMAVVAVGALATATSLFLGGKRSQ